MTERDALFEVNQLAAIGNMIAEMKRPIAAGSEPFLFLEAEFSRLRHTFQLLSDLKSADFGYYLEFHLAEAMRLENTIDIRHIAGTGHAKQTPLFKLQMVYFLKQHFHTLIDLLNACLNKRSQPVS